MGDREFEAISGPLARLFRLGASRNVQSGQAAAAGVDVTPPGLVLLHRLVDEGPLSLSDLSARADMDLGATSRQVKVLEADGLVERRSRVGDGRVTELLATDAGRRVRARIADVQDRHMADVLAGWSDDDQQQFAHLLDRFVEDLRSVQYRPSPDHRRSA
jgi:DNA-binding MarR family transcriptional regulator